MQPLDSSRPPEALCKEPVLADPRESRRKEFLSATSAFREWFHISPSCWRLGRSGEPTAASDPSSKGMGGTRVRWSWLSR